MQTREDIKNYIDRYIKANNNQEITGPVMNDVLKEMVDSENEWGTEGCVRYDKGQELTSLQQEQARNNIGTVSPDDVVLKESGDIQSVYGDLYVQNLITDGFTVDNLMTIKDSTDIVLGHSSGMPEPFIKQTTGQGQQVVMSQKAVTNQIVNLNERIDNISTIGRFLSDWDCAAGRPKTEPSTIPYEYHTGDYYIVSEGIADLNAITVDEVEYLPTYRAFLNGRRVYIHYGETFSSVTTKFVKADVNPQVGDLVYSNPYEPTPTGGTVTAVEDAYGYIPSGSEYDGSRSTATKRAPIAVGAMMIYDGTSWIIQESASKTATFSTLGGSWDDNTSLKTKIDSVDENIASADKIFICEYGVTTVDEIQDAIDAGKMPIVHKDSRIYVYANQNANYIYFGSVYSTSTAYLTLKKDTGAWNSQSSVILTTSRIDDSSTPISASSTDTQVPSSKNVYNAIQAIPVPESDLFWCEYGVTTADEIQDALEAGKLPVCIRLDKLYIYTNEDTTRYNFSCDQRYDKYLIRIDKADNEWSPTTIHLEQTANKVTSLSSASTDTQYPSAKCVYDRLDGLQLWRGTQEEYDLIETKDANTLYIIKEEE